MVKGPVVLSFAHGRSGPRGCPRTRPDSPFCLQVYVPFGTGRCRPYPSPSNTRVSVSRVSPARGYPHGSFDVRGVPTGCLGGEGGRPDRPEPVEPLVTHAGPDSRLRLVRGQATGAGPGSLTADHFRRRLYAHCFLTETVLVLHVPPVVRRPLSGPPHGPCVVRVLPPCLGAAPALPSPRETQWVHRRHVPSLPLRRRSPVLRCVASRRPVITSPRRTYKTLVSLS